MPEPKLTKRQAAIIGAYTGILCGSFAEMHKYVEEKFGHPVWTHQMANDEFSERLTELSRDDFLEICNDES